MRLFWWILYTVLCSHAEKFKTTLLGLVTNLSGSYANYIDASNTWNILRRFDDLRRKKFEEV